MGAQLLPVLLVPEVSTDDLLLETPQARHQSTGCSRRKPVCISVTLADFQECSTCLVTLQSLGAWSHPLGVPQRVLNNPLGSGIKAPSGLGEPSEHVWRGKGSD